MYGQENMIGQFADDTSLYLNGTEKSLEALLEILSDFEEVSGLKLNIQKHKSCLAMFKKVLLRQIM